MKNKDIRLGIVLMTIFVILFLITFTFQTSSAMGTHTTAAFFPRVVLIVLMILTALLIIQKFFKERGAFSSEKMDRDKARRVLSSMVLAILFVLGASYLGSLVSIALFVIAIMWTWGVRNKLVILLNAILTPCFIYLVFTEVLTVQLPSGILM